jgi:hypothetical protein
MLPRSPCLLALWLLAWAGPLRAAGQSAGLTSPLQDVAPGVQVAAARDLGGDADWGARVVLLDPAKVRLLVRFDEETPRLETWQARYPAALALLNGSFYSLDKKVRPTCDLVAGGKYEKGAGCRRPDALVLGAEGSTGSEVPRLLPLAQFEPGKWSEALKSFPSLVREGVPGCPGKLYCDQASRCAAIAQLRDGRLALFASQWPAVRRDVALFLAGQLGAVWAVNLDGGPEATLWVKGQALGEAIATPGTPLPLVLVVEPRPLVAAPPQAPSVAAPAAAPVVPAPKGAPQPDAGPRR